MGMWHGYSPLVVLEFLALGRVWPAVVLLYEWVRSGGGKKGVVLYGRSGEDKVRKGMDGGGRGVYPC